ncbi:AAA family ATPase [Desertimonas flava]|uniref:AAA family ATPase n=1 Tax=Desertimonas flava TaxID=2064846 RepID=UPI000E348A0F|nr:AAA family ATPase [Desertimonas flava]
MMMARDGELAAVLAAAELARAGAGRLVEVTGAPGSGKSTLLAAAVGRLRENGYTVWQHTATLPERTLTWAGLAALLTPVEPDVIASLPSGLGAHLASITAPDPSTTVQAHGVAVAVRELLVHAASAAPLAVVLDDQNWLDPPTAGVLTFAARSIADHPVVFVLSRRSDEPSAIDASAVPPDRRDAVELPGLTMEAIAELVRPIAGRPLSRSVLRAVHDRSGGNPMLASEIARQLAAGESLERALTPRSIVESLRPRLSALPRETLTAMQFAALLASASIDIVDAAIGGDALTALGPAEADGLVEVLPGHGTSPTIRFTHPTISAAALTPLSTAQLRAAHATLARLVSDPESRGVHLAASGPRPDVDTAATLEAAGELADRRGATEAAGQLYRASVAATPPGHDEDRLRRQMALATTQSIAVMHHELLATLAEIDAPPGSGEADRVVTMRVAAMVSCDGAEAARREALASIDSVTTTRGRMFAFAQLVLLERLASLDRGLQAALRAQDDAERGGDREAIETAALSVAVSRVLVGEPADIDDAVAGAALWPDEMFLGYAMEELAQLLWFAGDPRGIEWAERMLQAATARGDAVTETNALGYLAEMRTSRGEWAAAEQELTSSPRGDLDAPDRATLAFLHASTGRADSARRLLAGISSTEALGPINAYGIQARRAMTAFVLGDPDAADQLELTHQLAADIGLRAPRFIPYRRDYVEALVAAGRADEALDVAHTMTDLAERSGLDSARADADGARAVVASASGDDDLATRLFANAAKIHDRDGDRYELARTLLAAGRAARRARRRTEARRLLDEAGTIFTDIGAAPWLERCRTEAARIGGRPRRSATLTPTERQVAERAAGGATNAEIAAAMFVSLRTVEANLSRTYRKLGIRSRVDLAAALARPDT